MTGIELLVILMIPKTRWKVEPQLPGVDLPPTPWGFTLQLPKGWLYPPTPQGGLNENRYEKRRIKKQKVIQKN